MCGYVYSDLLLNCVRSNTSTSITISNSVAHLLFLINAHPFVLSVFLSLDRSLSLLLSVLPPTPLIV